jgi:hypothetical protein
VCRLGRKRFWRRDLRGFVSILGTDPFGSDENTIILGTDPSGPGCRLFRRRREGGCLFDGGDDSVL